MEDTNTTNRRGRHFNYELTVVVVAAVIYLGCILSPPALMDDVDAVQAQIARNMLDSGDWVSARLNGIAYLEKSPLKYWMIAVSYMIFGVSDVAARHFRVAGIEEPDLVPVTAHDRRQGFDAQRGKGHDLDPVLGEPSAGQVRRQKTVVVRIPDIDQKDSHESSLLNGVRNSPSSQRERPVDTDQLKRESHRTRKRSGSPARDVDARSWTGET